MSETKEPLWQWWASQDEERYTVGPETSREAVIEVARCDFDGESFYILEATQRDISFDVFPDALERIDEGNTDAGDPDEGLYWSEREGVTEEQEVDLRNRLAETARQWARNHGFSIRANLFGQTRNSEYIEPLPNAAPDPAPGEEVR